MYGVDVHTNFCTGRDHLAFDDKGLLVVGFGELAPESGSDGRGDPHGLIDAGTEVRATRQLCTVADLRAGFECSADFVGQAFVAVFVAGEVEEDACQGRRGRVATYTEYNY